MYIAEWAVTTADDIDEAMILEAISNLFHAYRMNGQALGREFPMAKMGTSYFAWLMLPDNDSLEDQYGNKYTKQRIKECNELTQGPPQVQRLMHSAEGLDVCSCENPGDYILFTLDSSIETPLRCWQCFDAVPLYNIPASYDDEHYDIIRWMSDYHGCYNLYINDKILERSTGLQLSKVNSKLNTDGYEISKHIELLTDRMVYYYIYGYSNKRRGKCQICGGDWKIISKIHERFDLICENCHLLSNTGW